MRRSALSPSSPTNSPPPHRPWLPRASETRAVLIGASTFTHPDISPLPAVDNNVADLRNAFTHPESGLLAGLPREHVKVLGLDGAPVSTGGIGNALAQARGAKDLLVVYYAGHGMLDDDGMLHLAVTDTDPDQVGFTAVPINTIKRQLALSRARARVLLLDCCFSGLAVSVMSTRRGLVFGQLPASGTYTLTSTAADQPSRAEPGAPHSVFTAALLRALSAPEPLTMDGIYEYVRAELHDLVLPPPQRQSTGDTALVGLARGPVPLPTEHSAPSAPRRSQLRPLRKALLVTAVGAAATAAVLPLLLNQQSKSPDPASKGPAASAPASASPTSAEKTDAVRASASATLTPEPEQLKIPTLQTRRTADHTVTIRLTGLVGNTALNGTCDSWGGGGEVGGSVSLTCDSAHGTSTNGLADFFVDTPNKTCKASGVAVGDSTVIAASSRDWTKILVMDVGRRKPGSTSDYATFQVTRGHGRPPEGTRTCA
ncbi:hypothetical protein ELQ87_05140 [Streptomyces griseoviridis]|uniref:Peptidase C14 caspase domain-containing protein n=1 Tax=Streptomyces griseoviridis TaxID=45398 RepID=A0A3Q9KT24_STRGD|nr:caspase family protein [Streptomyces griseoviridis]AZS83748.1 hypothetical protein ELQ87_05140 [Streptomyces griseoviridis]QCN89400.1 hypothetical protein DDJ31_34215 [Streptomyces griseoviridis]